YGIPVKHLFITHCHGDHVFGMAPFKDVEVFGSQELVANMKNRMEERWTEEAFSKWREEEPEHADSIDKIEVWLPEKGFNNKHTITDESLTVEFYHSGGHTSCSSYAYFPLERVLVTGDDLAAFNWPYIFDSTGNPDKWIIAFEEMLKLNPVKVVPGHGPIVGKEHVLEHLKYLKGLKALVMKVITEGKAPADIQTPEFYKPAEEWQIQEAMKHLYSYYSEMSNSQSGSRELDE
ncbi:MAG: MBL fold metallo-hydrolase, partial [Promethearchaeota archaeon]